MATRPGPAREDAPAPKRPRGRPAVPLERIIATALLTVEEEGAEALSMRALAQRLGSGTATLYRHFENRAALVAALADHLFGEIALDAEDLAASGWRRACRTIAHAMFDVLSRHGNMAPLLIGQSALGPNARALRERCLAILLDSGFPPRVAAYSYATLSRYTLGFATQLAAAGPSGSGPGADAFRETDPDLFPATAEASDFLPVPLEEEFAFGLELLLDGLECLRAAD